MKISQGIRSGCHPYLENRIQTSKHRLVCCRNAMNQKNPSNDRGTRKCSTKQQMFRSHFDFLRKSSMRLARDPSGLGRMSILFEKKTASGFFPQKSTCAKQMQIVDQRIKFTYNAMYVKENSKPDQKVKATHERILNPLRGSSI